MTGESLPVDKPLGDEVFCGTMNCFGSIDITASGVGEDSSLRKLIHMVQDAENKKAPMQRIADKWSVWLVPIALGIAAGTLGVNWVLGLDLLTALNRAVTVLVVFCPVTLSILGLLNPVTGALVHNAGSVLVVLNAALLYDRKFN